MASGAQIWIFAFITHWITINFQIIVSKGHIIISLIKWPTMIIWQFISMIFFNSFTMGCFCKKKKERKKLWTEASRKNNKWHRFVENFPSRWERYSCVLCFCFAAAHELNDFFLIITTAQCDDKIKALNFEIEMNEMFKKKIDKMSLCFFWMFAKWIL